MYLAKFDKDGLIWRVTIFQKIWCEGMLSHEVKEIRSKRFIFHRNGYRWIEKEVCQSLFYNHKLEIIDG